MYPPNLGCTHHISNLCSSLETRQGCACHPWSLCRTQSCHPQALWWGHKNPSLWPCSRRWYSAISRQNHCSNGQKRIAKRSKVKPFIKLVNYNHLMPTRYALDGIEQLKQQIGNDSLKEVSQREEARKEVKKSFEEKFQVCDFFFPLGKSVLTLVVRQK